MRVGEERVDDRPHDERKGRSPHELHDPVCGMAVERETPYSATHAGHEYLFCSQACLERFEAAPEHWAARGR
jgi:Cu+-exporting ATPase